MSGKKESEKAPDFSCPFRSNLGARSRNEEASSPPDRDSADSSPPRDSSSSQSNVPSSPNEVKAEARASSPERSQPKNSPSSGSCMNCGSDDCVPKDNNHNDQKEDNNAKEEQENNTLTQESELTYNFCIPSHYARELIGRKGVTVENIKRLAGCTKVAVHNKKNTTTRPNSIQICSVTGTEASIRRALFAIQLRLPRCNYPMLDLTRVNGKVFNDLENPDWQSLGWLTPKSELLNSGKQENVIVTSIRNAARFFVQLPSNPATSCAAWLEESLNSHYNQHEAPHCPKNLSMGHLVIARVDGKWLRAGVQAMDPATDMVTVCCVDTGVMYTVPWADLRMAKNEALFVSLPNLAVEVQLANLTPLAFDDLSQEEVRQKVECMLQHKFLFCHVLGQTENGLPLVHLYALEMLWGPVSKPDQSDIPIEGHIKHVNSMLLNAGLTSPYDAHPERSS